MQTLFEKYGGFSTFSALTKRFYQKLLDSPVVAHFFNTIDLDKLIEHQTNFLVRILGGPDIYKGKDLRLAHAKLGITEADLTEVINILEETLEEMEVESADIETILDTVAQYKSLIISG